MDRFRTMESFVRVVRAGSFTVAATQLGLSRALVSRHIGDLEDRLGVRLLNRSTRSLHLTDEGRSYLQFCEQVKYAGLDGHVESSSWFVRDQELGVGGQCLRDHYPLLHASRQFVRVPLHHL